jgi:hypothetical protein
MPTTNGKEVLDQLLEPVSRCLTNLTAIDPDSGKTTRLFNPRRDSWNAAFQVNGAAIIGRTPIGPATVRLLQMNRAGRLDLRAELAPKQRWP